MTHVRLHNASLRSLALFCALPNTTMSSATCVRRSRRLRGLPTTKRVVFSMDQFRKVRPAFACRGRAAARKIVQNALQHGLLPAAAPPPGSREYLQLYLDRAFQPGLSTGRDRWGRPVVTLWKSPDNRVVCRVIMTTQIQRRVRRLAAWEAKLEQ